MRTWRLALIALALLATAACHDKGGRSPAGSQKPPATQPTPPAPAPSTDLLSVAWQPTSADQNLQSFDLRLTGADLVLVCHKPVGWILEATSPSPGAIDLKGYATVGAAFISRDQLEDLKGLVLVRNRPADASSVTGKLLTGVYADDGGQSEVPASPSLLQREPAEQCPPPKA